MITPAYAKEMARYNAWQNRQLSNVVQTLDEASLTQDRGAFFGSILGTLNHLLWCDQLWLSRFDPAAPKPEGKDTELCRSGDAWVLARGQCDHAISEWASGLEQSRLDGDLTWHSGILQRDVSKPMAGCVVHFFNHQTHHRGQIHAMLTAAGARPGDTDLFVMPEDVGR